MANIKSAKKRAKTNEVRRQRNVARRSDIKTSVKKLILAIEEKNVDQAKDLLKTATSKLARATTKGMLKKNTASRKIGRLAKKVSALAKQ